ncbi:MAG: hypothetical protein IKB51_03920 [Clostridia bacterium]|nr:hypothetical protein [Clostridia bacterium]
MSTYKLTAADRRVLAQMQAQRASKPVYTRAAAARAAANSQTSGKKNEDKYKNANPFLRAFGTWYDIQKNISKGAGKAVEGVVDLGASLVGAVGGIFSDDFRDNVQDFIAEDWATKYYDESGIYDLGIFKDLDKYSYTNDSKVGQTIEQVAQGVGQMLPTVLIAIATGGTSLGASAATTAGSVAASTGAKAAVSAAAKAAGKWAVKNAGTLALGASAAGTGMEEAFNDGAGYGEGVLYGLASGATEIATEKLLPGPADAFIGKSIFGKGAKEVADQGVKRVLKETARNAVNEGFEEMVSEVTNPARKSIYKGRDAFSEYSDPEFKDRVLEAGKIGALTSVAFGATVGNITKGKGYNGDIQASKESIADVSKKRDVRNAKKALTKEERAEYKKSIEANEKQIEAVLKKASPEKRAEYIERYKLSGTFNEDGSLKPSRVSETEYNTEYYTPDLDGSEDLIKEDIDILNAKDGTNADVFNGELSENGKKHYTKLKKMLNSLNKRSANHVSLTVVDKNAKYKGVIVKDKHGQRIYIRSDVLESGDFSNTSIHEYGHSVEGTKAHTTLTELLEGDESLKTRAEGKFFAAEGDYGVTRDEINKILKKQESKEALTLEEKMKYEEFTSERGANLIAGELGTEEFIDKIVRLDENAARKLIGKIKDMKAAIKSLESKESREKYLRLRKAEKLFLQAAEQSGNVDLAKYIQSDLEDEEKEVQASYTSGQENSPIVEIEDNEELNSLIANSTRSKYDVIRLYLIDKFKGHTFTLSDGRKAIMDNSDAKELSHKANKVRAAQLGNLSTIIENAHYDHSEYNVVHDKFVDFHYYHVNVKYGQDEFPIWLNVGTAKNDGVNHIYSITNKKEDVPTNNGVGGPVGNHLQNTSSNNSISQNPKKSTLEVKKSKKIQHSYAGDHSKTADKGLLAQAEELEAQGATSEDIRKKTGWFRSYDKLWRYEIDDSKMEFLGAEVDIETTLGEVIKHDELFKAYPQLRDVKFKLDSNLNEKGYYNYGNNLIAIPANLVSASDNKLEKLLIHEIQHAIQQIEGFARGGNYNVNQQKMLKEQTRNLQVASGKKEYILRRIAREFGEYGSGITKEYEYLLKHPDEGEDYFNDIEEIETEMKEEGLFELVNEYIGYDSELAENMETIRRESWEKYQNTAGEIEAYDVADRLKLTPEERKNKRPDIDQDGVVFADDSHLQKLSEGEEQEYAPDVTSWKDIKLNDNDLDEYLKAGTRQNKSKRVAIEQGKNIILKSESETIEYIEQAINGNKDLPIVSYGRVFERLANDVATYSKNSIIVKDYYFELVPYDIKHSHSEHIVRKKDGDIDLTASDFKNIPKYFLTYDELIYAIKFSSGSTRICLSKKIQGGRAIIIATVSKSRDAIQFKNMIGVSEAKYQSEYYEKYTKRNRTNTGGSKSSNISPHDDSVSNNSIPNNSGIVNSSSKKSLKKIQHSYSYKNKPQRTEAEEKEICYASLLREADNFNNWKNGRFFSASEYKGETLKAIFSRIYNDLRNAREVTGGIRKSLLTVKEWYNSPDNKMLFKKTENNEAEIEDGQIVYDEDIAAFLEEICEGNGALNLDELKKLDKIGSHFLNVAEKYKRVFIDGKWVEAEKYAKQMVDIMYKAYKNKTFVSTAFLNKYLRAFGEPACLFRCADGYDDKGFFTWCFEAMRKAGVNIEVDMMNTLRSYREWHQAHKKWGEHLSNDTVSFRGQKIPIEIAMTLYCSLKTRKSQQGLADSGYEWREGKNNDVKKDKGLIEKPDPINKKSKKNRRRAVEAACKAAENELWEMFSESDRQYIQMFEKILNEECRNWKIETDKQMKGFSLVSEDGEYYFPTVHAQIKKTVSTSNYEGDRVAHLSSNKNVVEGARGSLLIEPIDVVVMRHIRNQLLYKHYAIVAENVSMLMNINVGNNVHNPKTLKTMIEEGGDHYRELLRMMDKLSKDLQGMPSGEKAEQRFIYDMVEFLRTGYAKYQLGANPKTLFSQLSSLIAACNILDFTSLARGIKGFVSSEIAHEVDKYCPIAELRNTDNVAAKAQGVIDKTGKVGDFLMKGIGFVDRRVVCALFNACQIQVEKDSGLKLGTEENKVEAGKLLSKVILETQQNTFVTERSDAMRGGVFARSFTMFSADSMKTMARWLDSIGKVSVLKRQIKNSTDEAEIKALESELKKANGQLVRSSSVIVSQAIFMALLAWGFRWLYNKDDEPDEEAKNIGADFLGNMLGGLPLLRDVYSYFSDGYELDNFMISTINDVLIASKKSMDLAVSAMKGETVTKQEVASSIKNTLYSAGQVLGIPVRNGYNFVTGLIRRFSPEAGYNVDNLFYKQSYNADLQKAIEKGDEDMIDTITGLILDENIGGVTDKALRSQINKLAGEGYSVLPRSVGDSVTYDGEEVALTKKQQKRFKELYSAAGEGASDLVKLQLYRNAEEAAQAKAIKFLYDTYYNLALEEALGVDLESKNVLFAEAIDIEKLAIIYAIASGIEADKDRKGNAIAGSRKAKIEKYVESLRMSAAEKYLIMGYLGYKCKNGEAQVKAYVNRLRLSKDEKLRLMEYCGYAA